MRNIVRFSPRHDIFDLQREFDSVFNRFFPNTTTSEESASVSLWSPRVDLGENDTTYFVRLDVPGIDKNDLDISLKDKVLTISGERKDESQPEGTKFFRREAFYGRFERRFRLPKAVNAKGIEATYTSGVLTIEIPKAEEVKPHQIKVS